MNRAPLLLRSFRRRWRVLTLARQYLLAGALVLVAGMATIGVWVTDQIAQGVTQNTAAATALYVDGVLAPLLPDIDGLSVLSEGARRALDETLATGALGERLETFKLWGPGGLITYSNDVSLIGQRFEPTASLRQAWSGTVAAEFDDLDDDEDASEREAGVPLLEIYNPIRAPWSGKVVAVAEFYEHAEELEATLRSARIQSWFVVGAVTLAMMGALFGIVLGGSATIARQRRALEARVGQLQDLLARNRELNHRVTEASHRVTALNERTLRRLSADLHDGPAQFLALAALRLGSPALQASVGSQTPGEITAIRGFLDEAMGDIRRICRDLALPDIEVLTLGALIETVARAHERRTGTGVRLDLDPLAPALEPAQKLGIYRFVQEGLTNSFRHAGGRGQSVRAGLERGLLVIDVGDEGPGFAPEAVPGLGLSGLRDRVESLGSRFEVETGPAGSRLRMILPLPAADREALAS